MRALIVDDDPVVRVLLRQLLEEEGYGVEEAPTISAARTLAIADGPALIVLDLGLPDGSGIPLVHALRRAKLDTPILVLTASTDVDTTVLALDAGADDFQSKPIVPHAFKARVRALVRRGGARRTEQLTAGNTVLDRLSRTVSVNGAPLDLTPKEFGLLEYLLLHAGEVVRRSTLLRDVLHFRHDPGTNVVDVNMMRLRKKLALSGSRLSILSKRGVGFIAERRTRADASASGEAAG